MTENQGMLSQDEIDALLASVPAEGETTPVPPRPQPDDEDENVIVYDFRRPDRFSKEQIRALRMIHENWARRVSVSLSAYLRGSVEVTLADVDQGAYMQLAQQLGVQSLYYIVGLVSLPGHFLLHLSLDLATTIVDRVMGGPGLGFTPDRTLTDLEIDLLRVIAEKMLEDLREAWGATAAIRPRIDDTCLNLLLVPIALPGDAIVWVTFEVRIKGAASSMTIGLPYPVIKPVANRLSPYMWMSQSQSAVPESAKAHQQDMQSLLDDVSLPISAILGSTQLAVDELASLRKGDIVPLDTALGGWCEVAVNGSTKFLGRPGRHGRKLAVQIERAIDTPSRPLAIEKSLTGEE